MPKRLLTDIGGYLCCIDGCNGPLPGPLGSGTPFTIWPGLPAPFVVGYWDGGGADCG